MATDAPTAVTPSSGRPLSMVARLDMEKSSTGNSLSHLTIKQSLCRTNRTISYSGTFSDDTILLNSKSSRPAFVKDVFPEYELDELVSFADDDVDFSTPLLTDDSMDTTLVDSVSQGNIKWSEHVVQKQKPALSELPKITRSMSEDQSSVEIDGNRRLTSAKIE